MVVQTTLCDKDHSVTKRPLEQWSPTDPKGALCTNDHSGRSTTLCTKCRFSERAIARAAMGALDQPTALALCHRVTCLVSTPSLLSSKVNLRKLILQLGARWRAPEMSVLEQRSYEEARR